MNFRTIDDMAEMDIQNIELKKISAQQTDNAMRGFFEKQGVYQIKTPRVGKSHVTNEMIKEFEMSNKIDSNGVPIIFESLREPEILQPQLEEVLTPAQYRLYIERIERYRTQADNLLRWIEEGEVANIQNEMSINRLREINESPGTSEEIKERNERAIMLREKTIQENTENVTNYRRILQITTAQSENARDLLEENEEKILRNQAAQAAVDEQNRRNRIQFEQMKHMRRNAMTPLDGESIDEYQERIQEYQPQIDDIQRQAKLWKAERFKNKLKEIIRKPSLIEEIINSLTDEELVDFDKIFPKLKTEFVKVFGSEYLDKMDVNDVLFLFRSMKNSTLPQKRILEANEEKEEKNIFGSPHYFDSPSVLDRGFVSSPGETFFTPQTKSSDRFRKAEEEEGEDEGFNIRGELQALTLKSLKDKISNSENEDIRRIKISQNKAELIYEIARVLEQNPKAIKHIRGESGIEIGFGLKSSISEIPKKFNLGKVVIDLHKLFQNNILSLRDKNNYIIPGYKNTRVSDEFVDKIMKLVHKQNISKDDLKSLIISERQLWDDLMFGSGLHKDNYTSHAKTIAHLKEQEQILSGELQARNNNPDLYPKYKDTLHKLHHFGLISQTEVKRNLREFKDLLKNN
jgi:hypothetical protein